MWYGPPFALWVIKRRNMYSTISSVPGSSSTIRLMVNPFTGKRMSITIPNLAIAATLPATPGGVSSKNLLKAGVGELEKIGEKYAFKALEAGLQNTPIVSTVYNVGKIVRDIPVAGTAVRAGVNVAKTLIKAPAKVAKKALKAVGSLFGL